MTENLSTRGAPEASLTPMMAQYAALKREHPGCVILFRLGDFYEVFFDDAPIVAKTLGIQLTARNKQGDDAIPMCGIPWHQLDAYLPDLLAVGLSVALCEQLESPAEAKARGSKAPLKRGITRLITPGTAVEDTILSSSEQRLLAAIVPDNKHYGLAWCDVAAGSLLLTELPAAAALDLLQALRPAEIVVPAGWSETALLGDLAPRVSPQASGWFKISDAESRLAQHYGLHSLSSVGVFAARGLAAAAAAVSYLQHTQQNAPLALRPPQAFNPEARLQLDAATVRNLELLNSSGGNSRHSLLACIDKTVTSGGARLLKQWLISPLNTVKPINERLDAVDFFRGNAALRNSLTTLLKSSGDMERAVTRLKMRRSAPRDLVAISETLQRCELVAIELAKQTDLPLLLKKCLASLPTGLALTEKLSKALVCPPPPNSREGGVIKRDYHPRIDELRDASNNSSRLIAQLEGRYKTELGITSLKIRQNNLIGFYIEVPAKHADAAFAVFQHRSTMANAARFTSDELKELERLSISGTAELYDLEHTLYEELVTSTLQHQDTLWKAAEVLAELDVLCGFAGLAETQRYARPTVDDSKAFDIRGGRHPVIEALLPRSQSFAANDCALGAPQRLWLLTGPNMAGKSTFLRQNALIALLAHCGCFVPAAAAHIGIIDRIFSRVGAGDDLARGQSTFMVEMLETAAILTQATERSLVILDEVGRGTATHDGLALATAVVEYLHDHNRSRTLFATHYHELAQLENHLPDAANYHAAVDFHNNDLVFLHNIRPGAAHASYGLHIGAKAGLPKSVLARAAHLLKDLEKEQPRLNTNAPLFSATATAAAPETTVSSGLDKALKNLNLDTLSPRAALDILYDWKNTYA